MPFISSPPGTSGGGGGSGTVTNVSSADTSIVVTAPTTTPSLQLATLDVIATNEPPAAAVPMNAKKITGLANGTVATDAAAFGQIPAALPPNGAAGGDLAGSYPNPTIGVGKVTITKLSSGVTVDVIAATNANLGPVAMNAKKITGLANGTLSDDGAAFGQIPTALPPNGAAGGDLTGSYPNPTLAAAGGGAAGPIGDATHSSAVTVDAKGRVTALASVAITGTPPGGSAGGDLTGSYPNPTLGTSGVAAATYGDSTHVAQVAVDAKGRITTASNVAISGAGASGSAGWYGDGSDGTVTFDGSTTVLGLAPSSSVYTLTRDIFLATGSAINNGVTIKTNGFRLLCLGALTNNGTIQFNGKDAVTTTGGNTQGNASGTYMASTSTGTAGAAGGTGAGAAGSNNGSQGNGAAGGTGGTGTGGAGGAGGTISAVSTGRQSIRALPWAAVGAGGTGGLSGFFQSFGGSGGGAGGGDGSASGGGGGGGGAAVVVLAQTITGTGSIQCRGGAGGTPAAGNTGGGGGGGGGWVVVISQSVSAGAIAGQTIDANGGAAGAPHGTGTNNATAGSNGLVVILNA